MTTFLGALWPEDPELFGELRAIKGGKVHQEFFALGEGAIERLTDRASALNDEEWDTYFGVMPRSRAEGTSDSCVPFTHVLWADVDAKHHSTDLREGKRLALAGIMTVTPAPQIIVDSGGGYHAYWLMQAPIDYMDARDVMAGIARRIGGDAVYDAARVLRLPGTWNWKRRPETYSRLLRFDAGANRLSDFDGYTYQRDEVRISSGPLPRMDELPDWLTDLIANGTPKGTRSESTFKAVLYLLKYGRTEEEVGDFIRGTPSGIGQKYAEMRGHAGERWLERTIEHARAVL